MIESGEIEALIDYLKIYGESAESIRVEFGRLEREAFDEIPGEEDYVDKEFGTVWMKEYKPGANVKLIATMVEPKGD